MSIPHNGTSILAALPAGTYRLRVDILDYKGKSADPNDAVAGASIHGDSNKNISLRMMTNDVTTDPAAASDQCSACQVGALNELTIYTPVSGTTDVPVVRIPPEYAGQTVKIYLYDPGDVSASSNTISIRDPFSSKTPSVLSYHVLDTSAGNAAGDTFQPGTSGISIYDLGVAKDVTPTTLVNSDGHGTLQPNTNQALLNTLDSNGSNVFNSKWLEYDIPVPSNYAPSTTNLANQYWQLEYTVGGGSATDTISLAVGFAGPPVHLVP